MKPLPKGSHVVRPFKTFKTHHKVYEYGGSANPSVISIDFAEIPPATWQWSGSTEPINDDGLYNRPLYKSINHLFYASGSKIPVQFDRHWTPDDSNNTGIYVINISQRSFGERIFPGTFNISSSAGTASIYDDGLGKLYSTSDTSTVVGNIFYPLGLAVISQMSDTGPTSSVVSHEGLFLSGTNDVSMSYKSQHTIYEHSIYCTLGKGEFNFSNNPSVLNYESSSVAGISASLIDDAMLSGSLTPYITTIALYDSVGNAVAVAKVPRPIKRAPEIDQTFIIRFDI